MKPRKLLILTYAFPPVGGIMVQRVLSFAKNLPKHGIQVHVLTPRNPATPVFDPALMAQVPPEVRVHRAITPEPPFYLRKKVWSLVAGRKVLPSAERKRATPSGGVLSAFRQAVQRRLSPDAQVLWGPFALRKASRLIQKYGIDTVLVTAPPFSLFLVGNELKRRFPNIRLISDFRDEWLRFMLTDFAFLDSGHVRTEAERIERETVEGSDVVVAVTRSSLEEIRCRYPKEPDRKFSLIPNGYDPELFEGFRARPHGQPHTVVSHTGTAYKTASPAYYLDALDAMPEQVRSQIETRFIGRVAETETGLFENRKSPVHMSGFVPQAEAVKRMEETDYLLLTMTNDFSLPGKLFEYLATGKPVLALSPPGGEVARLLEETGAGWCVDHTDQPAIQAMLERAHQARMAGRIPVELDRAAVQRYERPRLAERLAERILED